MSNFMEDFTDSVFGVIVATLAIIVLVFSVTFVIIRQIDHHIVSSNCPKQAVAYNRETKFVDYSYFSYECLVKSNNGTFVNINNLVNNIQD
jgi:hypothetical protein